MSEIDYSKVPVDYMVEPVRLYIEFGKVPGHFLTALFSNNLVEAHCQADDNNIEKMREWAMFLYWELPIQSWGSPEKVKAWILQGGFQMIKPIPVMSDEEFETKRVK